MSAAERLTVRSRQARLAAAGLRAADGGGPCATAVAGTVHPDEDSVAAMGPCCDS